MYQTNFLTVAVRKQLGVADPSNEKMKEVAAAGSHFRGEVINELIHLEQKIEICLARYFCRDTDRQQEFLWSVLRQRPMTMNHKATLLLFILKDSLSVDISVVKGQLEELMTIRNRLAHGDVIYDVATDTLEASYRERKEPCYLKLNDEMKRQIDGKAKDVDIFLNNLMKRAEFAEPGTGSNGYPR